MNRRQRTNYKVPKKKRLRYFADQLWSLAVRGDWAWACALCGNRKCEAHHLVPKGHEETRYDLKNGIALCVTHHIWDKDISPHQNAAGWVAWLREHYPATEAWYQKNKRPTFDGMTTTAYYCDVICRLREYVEPEDFERIVGVRFAAYLEEHL